MSTKRQPSRAPQGSGASSTQPTVRSLSRGLEILLQFDENTPQLTLRELIERTELPKTTVLRSLATLREAGLLWVNQYSYWELGPQFARRAEVARRTWELEPGLARALSALVREAQETAHVYIRLGLRRVCVAREECTVTWRHVVGIGDELPLHGGAASKILLLDAEDDLLKALVADAPPESGLTLASLREDVAVTRAQGYAVSHSEIEAGLSNVAVPLREDNGRVGAALSLSGPTARFTEERVELFVALLKEVATHTVQAWLPSAFSDAKTRSKPTPPVAA